MGSYLGLQSVLLATASRIKTVGSSTYIGYKYGPDQYSVQRIRDDADAGETIIERSTTMLSWADIEAGEYREVENAE